MSPRMMEGSEGGCQKLCVCGVCLRFCLAQRLFEHLILKKLCIVCVVCTVCVHFYTLYVCLCI